MQEAVYQQVKTDITVCFFINKMSVIEIGKSHLGTGLPWRTTISPSELQMIRRARESCASVPACPIPFAVTAAAVFPGGE